MKYPSVVVIGLFALMLLGLPEAKAQFATVRGRVIDAGTNEPMPGVNVLLESEDGRQGTASNADGVFLLTRLTPGTYVLTASFIGYETLTDTLQLNFNDTVNRTLELAVDAEELDEVVIETALLDTKMVDRAAQPTVKAELSISGHAPNITSAFMPTEEGSAEETLEYKDG